MAEILGGVREPGGEVIIREVKKWVIAAAVFLGGVALVGGGCGWSGIKIIRGMMAGEPVLTYPEFKLFKWCVGELPVVAQMEKLTDDDTYIVLLQNNYELRATGGFMGSFARISFKDGGMKNFFVQDIYEPDGKIVGHVEPPYPIQEAFRQGWWRLRDANWKVDFSLAAQDIGWFLEKGGEEKISGIVAVNMEWVKKLIDSLGPINVATYGVEVTGKNFYALAQAEAEVGWKPGSTQKRDFLGAVGAAVWEKVLGLGGREMARAAKMTKDELDAGQIWMWMKEPEIQMEVERRDWGGRLVMPGERRGDYLYVVESNLGANKANCCIKRAVKQEISSLSSSLREKVTISWANENALAKPAPPVFWGGDYMNYVRVVVPEAAQVASVRVSGEELRKAEAADLAMENSLRQEISYGMYHEEGVGGGLKSVGWWVKVPAGGKAQAEMTYTLEGMDEEGYRVQLRRQPGVAGFDYELIVGGKIRVHEWVEKGRTMR